MTELTKAKQSSFTKCMSSYISNIKSNNYSLRTRLRGSKRKCAFNFFFISKFLFCLKNLQIKSKVNLHVTIIYIYIKKTESRKKKGKEKQTKKTPYTHKKKKIQYNFFVQQA